MAPSLSLHCTKLIGPFSLVRGQRQPNVETSHINVLFDEPLWPMSLLFMSLAYSPGRHEEEREDKVTWFLLSLLRDSLWLEDKRRPPPPTYSMLVDLTGKNKYDSQQLTENCVNYQILEWMILFGERKNHYLGLNNRRHFLCLTPLHNAFSLLFIILIQVDPYFTLRLMEIESKSWVVLQPKWQHISAKAGQ